MDSRSPSSLAIKPSSGSDDNDSFAFNSCFNGNPDVPQSNFAQFFNLNDGSDESTRVNALLDSGTEVCVLEEIQYVTVRDAIQRAEDEQPGLYDLALRNCAPRILQVLDLLFHDASTDAVLLDYLATQLTLNGVGAMAKSNPQTMTTLYGFGAEFNADNTERQVVERMIDFTIGLFDTCGNGVIDSVSREECDEGSDNGLDGGSCTSFCSLKDAWYCPENFELGDQALSCNLIDNVLCDTECAETSCLNGSEYSGPGVFDPDEMTCNFTPCPWFANSIRLNQTHCVSGLNHEDGGAFFFDQVCTKHTQTHTHAPPRPFFLFGLVLWVVSITHTHTPSFNFLFLCSSVALIHISAVQKVVGILVSTLQPSMIAWKIVVWVSKLVSSKRLPNNNHRIIVPTSRVHEFPTLFIKRSESMRMETPPVPLSTHAVRRSVRRVANGARVKFVNNPVVHFLV